MATTKHFRKRDAILTYLQGTLSHPSAEMVYAELKQQIPDLSLGTVYRNLNLFKDQGLAISIGTVKGVERFAFTREDARLMAAFTVRTVYGELTAESEATV